MILAIISIICTLLLVVGIHEAGHALAARFFRVKITHVSIGFGKPLLQWQHAGGIKWIWALWPLGGYVGLLNSRTSQVDEKELSQCFDKKPIYARIIILLAGVFANVVAAWLALVLVYAIGIPQITPVIQKVSPQSIAANAGLQSGDQILAINGKKTPSWREAGMRIIIGLGHKKVPVELKTKQGQVRTVDLNLAALSFKTSAHSLFDSLGFKPDSQVPSAPFVATGFFDATHLACLHCLEMLYFFLVMLKLIVTGVIPFSLLLGPIGLFELSITTFSQGTAVFLTFIATFSLAVALINSFPVPGLDDGSVLYAVVEKIRGKAMSVAMEVLLFRLATIIVVVLLVNLLVNDLNRYLSS